MLLVTTIITAQEATVESARETDANTQAAHTTNSIKKKLADLNGTLRDKDGEKAFRLIDELLTAIPPSHPMNGQLLKTKLGLLLDFDGTQRGASEFLIQTAEDDAQTSQTLDALAWQIVAHDQAGKRVHEELLAAAMKVAERAVDVSSGDSEHLYTHANLVAISGDLERAIEIQEQAVEKCNDPKLKWRIEDSLRTNRWATSLNDVQKKALRECNELYEQGLSAFRKGQLNESLSLIKSANRILLQQRLKQHRLFYVTTIAQGDLQVSMDDSAAALVLYQQAVDISKKVLGEKHPDYATNLSRLAQLHQSMNEHASAVVLFKRVLEVNKQVFGAQDVAYAKSLRELAGVYESAGKYAEALPLAKQSLEIRKLVHGEQHPSYALSLSYLAHLNELMGEYATAMPLQQQATKLYLQLFGEQHRYYASSLNNLAGLYQSMGNYAAALPLFQQTLNIRKQVLGEQHSDYVICLDNLAMLHTELGDFTAARPLLEKALEIRRRLFGAQNPDYVNCLDNLAMLHAELGDFTAARPLLEEALEIRRKVFGKQHRTYAFSLNELATMYQSSGDYAAAQPLIEEALAVYSQVLGEQHPDYAACLNNLAMLHSHMGDYPAALPVLKQTLEINAQVLGDQHPNYVASLNNLAMLHADIGDYTAAQPLFEQALEIRRKVLGEQHPKYAKSLNSLATLYQSTGNYAAALPLVKQALEISKQSLGDQHFDNVTYLNNLAVLHGSMGDYEVALPLCRQVLEIRRKVLGEQHPDYGTALCNLAGLHHSIGEFTAALPLYQQAQMVLDEKHRAYADCLTDLAGLHYSLGNDSEGLKALEKATEISFDRLDVTSAVLSERQQKAQLQQTRSILDSLLSFKQKNESEQRTIMETVWLWKGSVTLRQQAYRRVADQSELQPLFEDLQSISGRLSTISGRMPVPPPPNAAELEKRNHETALEIWRQQFKELGKQREKLEAEIASKSLVFRQATEPLTVRYVQGALPIGTALVDFIEYDHVEADLENPGEFFFEHRYLAFVVSKNQPVRMLQLGSAAEIKQQIDVFRQQFRPDVTVEQIANASAAGEKLRRQIWEPIAATLGDQDTIIISPDTDISTLPFAALPANKPGTYLLEDYKFASLPLAGLLRGLNLGGGIERPIPEKGLLVVGDVDYNRKSPTASRARANPRKGWRSVSRSAPRGDSPKFDDLEYAQTELASVSDIFKREFNDPEGDEVSVLRQQNATEEAFLLQAPKHFNLHIITHGFFAAPEFISVPAQTTTAEGAIASRPLRAGFASRVELGRSLQISRYQPSLLAGLAMAGANDQPSEENPADDGILTAAEIEPMNLNTVDLVVLSACETGLGKSTQGEGLTGLQRAFHLAGARSCVASLWKVPDKATNELMRRFYKYYWQDGESKIDALRQAQLDLLHDKDLVRGLGARLSTSTSNKTSEPAANRTHPRFWAAFQLSGDWR